jgi:hypothetical protein
MFAFAPLHKRKSTHPLADPDSTRDLIQAISEREGLERLQGFCEVLDALKTAKDLSASRALEVVDQLDRAGRAHWRKATHDYYTGAGRLTNYQANRLWMTVGEYMVQLAEGYELCLAGFETGGANAASLNGQIPRTIGRALRLRGAAQSWDYVRYANQFGRWGEVYRLYRLAEIRGCADQKVMLYRGGRPCTIEQELMQVLLLAVAAPQSMLPEQIDVADRITARLAHCFSLAGAGKGNGPYFFDPASSNPPAREQPGIRPPVMARRFGPGDAKAELKALAARAARGDLPLSEIGVDRHSQEIVSPTVQHLVRYWCDGPPERRFTRRRVPQRIEVAHGLEEIISKVGNMPTAYPFVSAQEKWLIENSGEGGIGVLAAMPHGLWATIGCLVAFRYPEAGVWNLGIVRHLSEDKEDRFLGIQLLSRGGVAVSVRRFRSARAGDDADCLGVWLTGEASKENVLTMLLPRGIYTPSATLYMQVHGREYLLTARDRLAVGSDYEIAQYGAAVADDGAAAK